MLKIEELQHHHAAMLRYALFQLNDAGAAEDAVQEAILAALEKPESFQGQSSLKTWLMGILKYKVLDVLRRQYRDPQLIQARLDEENDRSDMDGFFDQTGHWGSDAPRHWAKPEACLEDRQFWQVYEECAQKMPRRTAMVFAMREVMELEIAEICQQLDITATNCSVLLYRARMSLRLCLDKNWFGRA
ncbi:sigma-70 family RNA polymerase sigma factor [Chitinibacter bivalviorum]|uniref:Sigma-70 family RNA polymerase sigma factor n=1 Tax=Chitinibacter bivalviorum TaxID=2739434 RepID=A0A7H9BKQ3_9NEIS|nr:sigma-70 family RNA polymerase sigma factor [Chitinibacter bivalviorum]QLG89250.1 sigma-70 family RNA polymerase sigma factor [Chitinibacter bivalviorum]